MSARKSGGQSLLLSRGRSILHARSLVLDSFVRAVKSCEDMIARFCLSRLDRFAWIGRSIDRPVPPFAVRFSVKRSALVNVLAFSCAANPPRHRADSPRERAADRGGVLFRAVSRYGRIYHWTIKRPCMRNARADKSRLITVNRGRARVRSTVPRR